jgi:outer membrane protein TolC
LLARQFNPSLAAARHDAASRRHAIALARKSDRPDITLGVEYARGGSGRMAMGDGGGEDMAMAMVSFSLPIWRDKVNAGIREAFALHGQATRLLADQTYAMESAMMRSLYGYRDSGRKLDLYGATLLPKARQSLAALEAGYRVDKAAFSDVLDAQRTLLEFELAHERAAADRLVAAARIWTIVGGTDKVPSSGTSDIKPTRQQSASSGDSAGGHP